MRVILDLQACQSGSRLRGIGRSAMSLAQELTPLLIERKHEVIIALSHAFQAEGEQIKSAFARQFPELKYYEFSVLSPCAAMDKNNLWRQMASRILREHALACLEPDIVHVPTLLADGWEGDLVASVGMLGVHVPTALTQHDLIPLAMSDIYLPIGTPFRHYYMEKLTNIIRSDLLLSVSEYSKNEALSLLKLSENSVINISSAVSASFLEHTEKRDSTSKTLEKHKIPADFILYAPGGFDARKNFNTFLEAYSLLPQDMRTKHKLVIVSKLDGEGVREGLIWKAGTFGVDASELIITDYVPDSDLINLYKTCRAYVFPSLHEGFGLPVLEAMSFGAVVIASNSTSIPEAHGLEEALFDPTSPSSIADKMQLALTDDAFRARLQIHARQQTAKFSWSKSAQVAADAMERLNKQLRASGWHPPNANDLPSEQSMLKLLEDMKLDIAPSPSDIENFYKCYTANKRGARV